MPSTKVLTQSQPFATRDKLLSSAEELILKMGSASVSTRTIGSHSGLNWALVTYHFGGMPGLLAELLMLNIDKIATGRETSLRRAAHVRGRNARLEAVLAAYTDPLWVTKAAWATASAYAVVRDLLPTVDDTCRQKAVAKINQSVDEVARALHELLPNLSKEQMVARLRLLSGAAEMILPHVDQLGLFSNVDSNATRRQTLLRTELNRVAKAALLA